MRRLFSFICFLLFSFPLLADEVTIELSPSRPVKGESFNIFFKISTQSQETPKITFNPRGFEIIDKQNQGVSTRSTYINGKFSTSRELIYRYEAIANKTGLIFISDIRVTLGNQVLRHANKTVQVYSQPMSSPKLFAKAVPSKTEIFEGEGIMLRYYIYHKVQIVSNVVKKFPKLVHFLKRFIQERDQSERVEYNGEIYYRTLIYSAQLFPEKKGILKIDPIRLGVKYATRSRQDPFGGFGLGLGVGNVQQQTISSKLVDIVVKPLPVKGMPSNFTGLVGRHTAKLESTKSKFLVNEPIELKLIIDGKGALENYEGPALYSQSSLEEFERNGDLKLNNDSTATKTFEYTYLARENAKIEERKLGLSFFDPNTETYKEITIGVPAIEVAGGAFAPVNKMAKKQPLDKREQKNPVYSPEGSQVIAPEFTYESFTDRPLSLVNNILSLILAVLLLLGLKKPINYLKARISKDPLYGIDKKNFQYSDLNRFIERISTRKEIPDFHSYIESSDVSGEAKAYFLSLIDQCEKSEYSQEGKPLKIDFNEKHFKEILNKAFSHDSQRST